MKYLKKYNESNDTHHAIVKVKGNFTEEIVSEMLADEVKEWTDETNYKDFSNGEAEEIVISQLISWYEKEFSKNLSSKQVNDLQDAIKQEYKSLN
jgi:hypothetical protein